MTLFRRGKAKTWQYDFWKNGQRFQGSTGCTNKNDAREIESTVRTNAAKAKFGIGPPKVSPTLSDFLEGAFERHVEQNVKARRSKLWYRDKVKRLLDWPKWKATPLDKITGDLIGEYIASRSKEVASVATLNGDLRCLRKAMLLAKEFDLITKNPKVKALPGEKGRDFVVSPRLEQEYMEAAQYPLRQVATLVLDLGLRPEEAARIRKSDISRDSLEVREGKSKNAKRVLPLTSRASETIELLRALFPASEFLFPGYSGKHLSPQYLSVCHTRLRQRMEWPEEWVLYSFRHTAATRLADAGATPFELMAFLGHSDIKMVMKYVHTDPSGLRLAMKRREMMEKLIRGEDSYEVSQTLPSTGSTS